MFLDFVGQSYPQSQIYIPHANLQLQCVMKQTLCPQEPVKLLLFINLDPHNLKWIHRSLPVVKVFLKRPSAATGIRRYLIVQHTGEFGVQIKQSKTLHNIYQKIS